MTSSKLEQGLAFQPKCPACDAKGSDLMNMSPSRQHNKKGDPSFYAVFCGSCGHVYGVIAPDVPTALKGEP